MGTFSPLERIRRPEFTGPNRCWLCTILNGLLLWIGVTVVAMVGHLFVALCLAVVGLGAIAIRGYLVPFTPQFAPQLVSILPGDPFDHEKAIGSLSDLEASHSDGLSALIDAGVVVPDGDELTLESATRTTWHSEMESLRDGAVHDLADVANEVTPDSVDARGQRHWGKSYVVLDATGGLTLLPKPIAVAELAAARALESRVDDRVRLAAGRPFRTLLESCPLCDGELTVSASACCGDVSSRGLSDKLVCPACSVRLLTYD